MTLKKSVLAPLLLITCLAALAAGGSPAHAQEAENAEVSRMTAEELSATCKALSQSDAEGRIYYPIIGKYIKDKSSGGRITHPQGTIFFYTMALEKPSRHIVSIYSPKVSKEYYKQQYEAPLQSYFFGSHSKETFGICAYSNASGQLMDRISTLTIITDE